jgi:hypothetical protein
LRRFDRFSLEYGWTPPNEAREALRRRACAPRCGASGADAAIEAHVAPHNERGRPSFWTAKAADILEKMLHAQQALDARRAM